MARTTDLEKLKAKLRDLEQKVKDAEEKEHKKQAAIQDKRNQIIANALIAEMADNPDFLDGFAEIIDRRTTKKPERQMLGLAVTATKRRTKTERV